LEFNFSFAPGFAIVHQMKSPLAKRARVDRKVISIVDLHDDDSCRLRHWLRQSPMKRLEGLELLRQSAHAYDPVTARLPRLLTVAQRKRKKLTSQ